MAQQPDQLIAVRTISTVHATVTQGEPGADCSYAYQFILDDGAEERVWQLSEDDADQIQNLLQGSKDALYDVGRNALIFKDLHAD